MKIITRSLLAAVLTVASPAQAILAERPGQKAATQPASGLEAERLAHFEKLLDALREQLKIPAMSCAIVKDQKVVWVKGFGYADVENKIAATEHTSYHLASLTKTFASTILMKLVQDGKVNLDDPVSKYGITIESPGVIKVRHLFSHTSEGNPGERYSYNGNRFAELDKVVQKASGRSFAEVLITDILDPLGMTESAPNVPPVVRTKSTNPVDAKSEDEVKAVCRSLIGAYNSANAEQIEKLLAAQQSGFRSDAGYLTLAIDPFEVREQFRTGVRVNIEVHELDAAVYGNAAVTTCLLSGLVTLPGGATRSYGPYRSLIVWNKEDGSWKLAHSHQSPLERAIITEKQRQRFEIVSKNLAQPYQLDNKSNIVKGQYPTNFSVSAGLTSSVLDMAKYDVAVDQNRFLAKATQQLAFTPAVSTKGETLPYGLGWFTQNYRGTSLIWHYGYWTCNSSLILKVPDSNITFIAMANTDNLSRPTDLGAGDVTSSPVGLAFLKTFIFPEMFGGAMPEINWQAAASALRDQLKAVEGKPYATVYTKELLNQARMYASVGRAGESSRLFKVYGELYSKPLPDDLAKRKAIAEIVRVGDDSDKTVEFALPRAQGVRVFAAGEGQGGEMFDYGWIESVETGKQVWVMKAAETKHAGGAGKNRMVDAVVTLRAGKYRLRYKSDDSHAFDRWNALPPDINFWGIAVYANE
ncbi:MAG TPA: serine hydrolase domain-containing protein [Blastocatellia bacterium]|nr:serine hydrolase domain-containing protein [Blastocatellia bacterium]